MLDDVHIPRIPLTEERYSLSLAAAESELGPLWSSRIVSAGASHWKYFAPSNAETPEQGWKLHVSCATDEAADLVTAAASILARSRSSFKVPASIYDVASLNCGTQSPTQIGKILTIYPSNNNEFATLAEALISAWTSDRGPWILSDVCLSPGRRVFARYGAFRSRTDIGQRGQLIQLIRLPDDTYDEDERSQDGSQASWVPPLPGSVAASLDGRYPKIREDEFTILGTKYIPIHNYISKPGSYVARAVDTQKVETVIVKRARRGVFSDRSGRDAIDRLINEYSILLSLREAGFVACPMPFAFSLDSEVATLVLEDIGMAPLGSFPRNTQLNALRPLGQALVALHDIGYVHGDVKPGNVMVGENSIVLIDFELSAAIGSRQSFSGGTPGFCDPSRIDPVAGNVDDYAFGATIFTVVTGMWPGDLPYPDRNGRMVGVLQRLGFGDGASIVSALTGPTKSTTSQIRCVAPALERLTDSASHNPSASPVASVVRMNKLAQVACRTFERSAEIHAASFESLSGAITAEVRDDSLYSGTAGEIIGLMSIASSLGFRKLGGAVPSAAEAMARAPVLRKANGLLVGNAGIAVALAMAAMRLGRPGFVADARRRLQEAVRQNCGDYDFTSGSAGIVWAGCVIASVLGQSWPLDLIEGMARDLHDAAFHVSESGIWWPSSSAYDVTRKPYFGAAHGAAGIGLSLALWGHYGGRADSKELGVAVLHGLCKTGLMDDGVTLREGPGRRPVSPGMWCHGTLGLVWALIAVSAITSDLAAELEGLSIRLVRGIEAISNPHLCHGLAALVDVFRCLKNMELCENECTLKLERLLDAAAGLMTRRHGGARWGFDGSRGGNRGLIVGDVGVAATLALARTGASVPLLSCEWFRTCATLTA